MTEITITDAVESVQRIVKPTGNGSHVTVPAAWLSRKVTVVLLEELI